jgi:glucans biosynthesis protein
MEMRAGRVGVVDHMKTYTNNPMQPANLARSPRCGARTRSGGSCNSPAVQGRQRCRMHGGTNRGAPRGNRNAWVHGDRSAEAKEQLKLVKAADRLLGSVRLKRCRQAELLANFNELISGEVEPG